MCATQSTNICSVCACSVGLQSGLRYYTMQRRKAHVTAASLVTFCPASTQKVISLLSSQNTLVYFFTAVSPSCEFPCPYLPDCNRQTAFNLPHFPTKFFFGVLTSPSLGECVDSVSSKGCQTAETLQLLFWFIDFCVSEQRICIDDFRAEEIHTMNMSLHQALSSLMIQSKVYRRQFVVVAP